jgi:hypothetical protein
MKCWVCTRHARGFGHTDNRYPVADARRYPIDWAFCSQRCLAAFHALYARWAAALEGEPNLREAEMLDASEVERAAMRECLRALGAAGAAIGFGKCLGQYTEAEALLLIDAVVSRYTEAMLEHHEATKYPPVRGAVPVADPLAVPFADMPGDTPWEAAAA